MLGAMNSDDIPVGSPPVPPGRHAAPSGWYADPVQPGRERYWDGWQWTRNVREVEPGTGDSRPASRGWSTLPSASPPPAGPNRMLTTDEVVVAEWGQRALAAIIDLIIVWVVTQIVVGIHSSVTGAGIRIRAALQAYIAYVINTDPAQLDFGHALSILITPDVLVQLLLQIGILFAYRALFHGAVSATPGKMLLGLRVVPTDRGRQHHGLPWGQAIGRALVYTVLSKALTLLQPINLLWPLWDKKRQTWHDKIAGTQVVRIK